MEDTLPGELSPNPESDQHLMADEGAIAALVDAAQLAKSDVVLEIGGGVGALTKEIAKRSGKVIIFENDPRYSKALYERFGSNPSISIVGGDILSAKLPEFNKIVSNPPYSIIKQIFLKIAREKRSGLDVAVMTLPYRFTMELTAQAGSPYFNLVSVLAVAFFNISVLFRVDKSKFNPPPRVTSFCVKISMKPLPKGRAGMAQLMLQGLFLYDRKKADNIFRDAIWNYGYSILGSKAGKKEAAEISYGIFHDSASFGGKTASNLSRKELSSIMLSLDRWVADEE